MGIEDVPGMPTAQTSFQPTEVAVQKTHKCKKKSHIVSSVHAAPTFFSFNTFGLKTASCPVILLPRARSSFAPRASLLRSSFFSLLRVYRCWVRRLSSRRSNPAFHDLISWARGSPAVDEAEERCDGAIEGVRVGVVL